MSTLMSKKPPSNLQVGRPFNPFRLFTGILIPDILLRSTEVSPAAKLLYGRLTRYAGQDGRCYPAVRTLAAEVGLGQRQTQRRLAELEHKRLIRRVTRYAGRTQTSNEFEFLWHEIFDTALTDSSAEGTSDSSPTLVSSVTPKESQSKESQSKERRSAEVCISKADSRHASLKTNEDMPMTMTSALAEEDMAVVSSCLADFMDGEDPPKKLVRWISDFAERYQLSHKQIIQALDAAWNRNARPGRKNRPRLWNWFYEVLRTAFIPGYAARLPEAT